MAQIFVGIIGIVLIILQFISVIGTLYAGEWIYFTNIHSFEVLIYDLIGFLAYSFWGILGVILLIVVIREYREGKNTEKGKENNNNEGDDQ